MKRFLFVIIAGFMTCKITAQSLTPVVISTSGAFYSNSSGMLSSTIGEMSMVKTFTSANGILNQGFQQVYDFNIGIDESSNNLFALYPNPTAGDVMIRSNGFRGAVDANVYDVTGKLILEESGVFTPGAEAMTIHLSGFADGIYFLELRTATKKLFSKINLVR